jgi:hypothetical protein
VLQLDKCLMHYKLAKGFAWLVAPEDQLSCRLCLCFAIQSFDIASLDSASWGRGQSW